MGSKDLIVIVLVSPVQMKQLEWIYPQHCQISSGQFLLCRAARPSTEINKHKHKCCNSYKALYLVMSITVKRLGSDMDKYKVARVCTSSASFLISSQSASLVSSDVGRSDQQSGDSQRNEGPFHHKSLLISALALQPHDGRSAGFEVPEQNFQLTKFDS